MPNRPIKSSDGGDYATRPSLIDGLKASNGDAWNRSVHLYEPLLRHWARRFGADRQDFADVRQAVHCRVVLKIGEFQLGERLGSFRAWLREITRHVCLELSRAEKANGRAAGGTDATAMMQEFPDHCTNEDDPTELVAEVSRRAIAMVRSEFSDTHWQVFEKLTFDSQSPADVATELGLTPVNVRAIKSRIYRRLREELGYLLDGQPVAVRI